MNKYQYTIDRCCGGPCINRKPLLIQERPLTGIEKEREYQLDAIQLEYLERFGGNK